MPTVPEELLCHFADLDPADYLHNVRGSWYRQVPSVEDKETRLCHRVPLGTNRQASSPDSGEPKHAWMPEDEGGP